MQNQNQNLPIFTGIESNNDFEKINEIGNFFLKYACENSDFNLLKTGTKCKARYKFDLEIVLGGATILIGDASANFNGTSKLNSQSGMPRKNLSQKKNFRLKIDSRLETFDVNEFLHHLKNLKHALIKLTTVLRCFQRDIDSLKVQPSDYDTSVLYLINAVAAFGVTEDNTDNNFSVPTCNTDGSVRATLHAFPQHSTLVQMLHSCYYIHRRFASKLCGMGGKIERQLKKYKQRCEKPNKYKQWCEQRCLCKNQTNTNNSVSKDVFVKRFLKNFATDASQQSSNKLSRIRKNRKPQYLRNKRKSKRSDLHPELFTRSEYKIEISAAQKMSESTMIKKRIFSFKDCKFSRRSPKAVDHLHRTFDSVDCLQRTFDSPECFEDINHLQRTFDSVDHLQRAFDSPEGFEDIKGGRDKEANKICFAKLLKAECNAYNHRDKVKDRPCSVLPESSSTQTLVLAWLLNGLNCSSPRE